MAMAPNYSNLEGCNLVKMDMGDYMMNHDELKAVAVDFSEVEQRVLAELEQQEFFEMAKKRLKLKYGKNRQATSKKRSNNSNKKKMQKASKKANRGRK